MSNEELELSDAAIKQSFLNIEAMIMQLKDQIEQRAVNSDLLVDSRFRGVGKDGSEYVRPDGRQYGPVGKMGEEDRVSVIFS